jgi:uncharacterized membrane protein
MTSSLLASLALVTIVLGLAVVARPWRALAAGGPPWPWVLWAALMPLLWGADRYVAMPVAQPLSGASLLVLMCGWPLAMLVLVPVTLATVGMAGLSPAEGLERALWLGVMPGTVAFALGAAVRRWLPHHLIVYILGRGFFATVIALASSGTLHAWMQSPPGGLAIGDLVLGRTLAAFGEAWITGMMAAIFVAFRPQWLATYADRIYLPEKLP